MSEEFCPICGEEPHKFPCLHMVVKKPKHLHDDSMTPHAHRTRVNPNYVGLYDGPFPIQIKTTEYIESEDYDNEIYRAPIEVIPMTEAQYINFYAPFESDLKPKPWPVAAPPIRQPKPRFRLRHLAGIIAVHLLIVFALEAWGVRPVERIRHAIVQFIHLEKP